jgi:hypothetical protein
MTTDPIPDDIDDAVHASLVAMAALVVEQGTANGEPEAGIVDAVKRLAETAAQVPGFEQYTIGCDTCDGTYSNDVIEAADAILPAGSQLLDGNDDPDVYSCPFCCWESANEPPDIPEPESDTEFAEMRRQQQEDEASMVGYPEELL